MVLFMFLCMWNRNRISKIKIKCIRNQEQKLTLENPSCSEWNVRFCTSFIVAFSQLAMDGAADSIYQAAHFRYIANINDDSYLYVE